MTYSKVPSAITGAGSPTKVPTSITSAPADSVYTEIPAGSVPGALDGWAASANGLWCFGARLRSAYTGPIFRVINATTLVETDIGSVSSTNRTDLDALAAALPGANGFAVGVYDQSGNGRTLTPLAGANRPKVYDSVTGPTLVNGVLAATLTGGVMSTQRTDNCGITGTGGKTMMRCCSIGAAGAQLLSLFGSTTTQGQGWQMLASANQLQMQVGLEACSRTFTCSDYRVGVQKLVARLQASGTAGQLRLRQNGVDLSELTSVNPGVASNTTGALTRMGNPGTGFNGSDMAMAVFGADVSDADAALWTTAMTALYG